MDIAKLAGAVNSTTMNSLQSSQSVGQGFGISGPESPESPLGDTLNSFGNLLTKEMDKINVLDADARSNVQSYASGGDVPLHQVIMSVEKADMALKMASQVRNKLVGAYQEISRMQV